MVQPHTSSTRSEDRVADAILTRDAVAENRNGSGAIEFIETLEQTAVELFAKLTQ